MKVQIYHSSSTTKINLRGSHPCALSGTPIWTMQKADRVTEVPSLENYSCSYTEMVNGDLTKMRILKLWKISHSL